MLSALLFSAALVFTEADADLAWSCASNLVDKCTVRDAGTVGAFIAADWILDTASMQGADVHRDRFKATVKLANGKVATRTFTNLYAMFKTTPDAPWVVFVSHYDTKPGKKCPGANDGASTTGLLISLASALADGRCGARIIPGATAEVRKANVLFVWLDGEECIASYGENDGFWGSKRAAAELRRRALNVCAVVCLDMLGDRNLDITIPSNGSEKLAAIAKVAAQRVGVTVGDTGVVKDDHVAFLDAGFPAIDLIDFDYGSAPGKNDWWHTPQDTMDKVSRKSLLKSGRLAAELLNILAK